MAECCSGLSLGSWWPSFVLVGYSAVWQEARYSATSAGPAGQLWPCCFGVALLGGSVFISLPLVEPSVGFFTCSFLDQI